MALPDEKETTFYYSYTNMQTTGRLTLNGKTFNVQSIKVCVRKQVCWRY